MKSLSLRTAVGTMLTLASAAVWFAAEMDEGAKSAFALGLMLLASILAPRRSEHTMTAQPAPILWKERDIGQQFSMIMFHVVVLAFLAWLAFELSSRVGGIVGSALAAALMCVGVFMTVRNWKNRNAG